MSNEPAKFVFAIEKVDFDTGEKLFLPVVERIGEGFTFIRQKVPLSPLFDGQTAFEISVLKLDGYTQPENEFELVYNSKTSARIEKVTNFERSEAKIVSKTPSLKVVAETTGVAKKPSVELTLEITDTHQLFITASDISTGKTILEKTMLCDL
jgi:hypothetical protein